MNQVDSILSQIQHRPFDLPRSNWRYYQEWNHAVFLHWKVDVELLNSLIPKGLEVDTYNGSAYVSLVAFTMQKVRPRYLPSIKFISDFDEINVRTYIQKDNKKGVYFLSIEAGRQLSAMIAGSLSGLPYKKSNIQRSQGMYSSSHAQKNFNLNIEYQIGEDLKHKSELDIWLTERYCLYFEQNKLLYRYDIHHLEWPLKNIEIKQLDIQYEIGSMHLNSQPDLMHYSDGVKVLAWGKEILH